MENIRKLISEGDIDEAISLLIDASGEETKNDILLLSSRYKTWKRNSILGFNSSKEEINQITNSLLFIIDEINKQKIERRNYNPKLIQNLEFERPIPEKPLLIGFLVDVSASMLTSIENKEGGTQSRLDTFQNSLEDLVKSAKEYCLLPDGKSISPLFHLFVYGFGFGNVLSVFLKGNIPKVKSIIRPQNGNDVITISEFVNNWEDHKTYAKSLAAEMFGNTPLYEALKVAKSKIISEQKIKSLTNPTILFIVSDGEPTDASPDEIIAIVNELKMIGVIVVSTFLTEKNVTKFKRLYSHSNQEWDSGANLMFECASVLPPNSPFYNYLQEFNWEFDDQPRLFSQVNQTQTLKEFINLVLSPIRNNNQISPN